MNFLRFIFPEIKGAITLNTLIYGCPDFTAHPDRPFDMNQLTEAETRPFMKAAILARHVYFGRIKQSFGLGYIFSFFPFESNAAYQARKEYVEKIHALDKHIAKTSKQMIDRALFATSSWFFLFHFFTSPMTKTVRSRDDYLTEQDREDRLVLALGNYIMNWKIYDFYYPERRPIHQVIAGLLHTIFNPPKLCADFLTLLNDLVNVIPKHSKSPSLRFIKFIFLPFLLFFRMLETMLDMLIFYPLKNLVIAPIVFIEKSIHHTIKHLNSTFEAKDILKLSSEDQSVYEKDKDLFEEPERKKLQSFKDEAHFTNIFVLIKHKKYPSESESEEYDDNFTYNRR